MSILAKLVNDLTHCQLCLKQLQHCVRALLQVDSRAKIVPARKRGMLTLWHNYLT
jgi:hypothetical protein